MPTVSELHELQGQNYTIYLLSHQRERKYGDYVKEYNSIFMIK